jgi:hypothetical protein
MHSWIGFVLVFALAAAPLAVNAQASDGAQGIESAGVMVPGVGVMTTSQIKEEIERLEKKRDEIKLAGPRAGVGITSILVPGGVMMLGAGAALRSLETEFLCPSDDPQCREPAAGSKAMLAAGAVVLVGGMVGIILTSRKLKQSKQERERIDRRIRHYERPLLAPSE